MAWEIELDLSDYEPEDAFTGDDLAAESVPVLPVSANGRVIDLEAAERNERVRRAVNVARAMYDRGLLTDETLAATYPLLWDKVVRKRVAVEQCKTAVKVWREMLHWLDECQPGLDTVMETGFASVTMRKLGTSEAAAASRKIRDWHKVTRYRLRKAEEAGDCAGYIRALRFMVDLLAGFMNTRYWAIAENARSVEDRALGGNKCKYNAVGAPKSPYKLVMHNQIGMQVSASLKRAEPVYMPTQPDSPEHRTDDIAPFPKIQTKRSKLRKWQG